MHRKLTALLLVYIKVLIYLSVSLIYRRLFFQWHTIDWETPKYTLNLILYKLLPLRFILYLTCLLPLRDKNPHNVHHNISLSSEYKVHRPVKSVPETSLSKNSMKKAKLEKLLLILAILERHDILIYMVFPNTY